MSNTTKHNKEFIPQLRFPNFQDKWEKVIISKIANKITDGTHDTPKPIKEGVPFLTAIHVKDGKIDFDNCYYLSEEEHNKIYKRCNPEFGDLLMVNIGAGTATSAMVNVNYEFSLKNVALIKPNKTKIYPSFFAQVQRKNSDRLRHQISSGGAQPFLSLKAIGKLKLNIPKINEQQKIAAFLTDVDDKITKLTKKKTLLEQYKKGVMQKIFNQELRFKDDNGNTFPNWEEKKIKDLDFYISDGNYGEMYPKSSQMKKSGVPFIRANNIKNLNLVWDDMKFIDEELHSVLLSGHLKENDILITTRGEIGMLAYVTEQFNGANINAQICLLRCNESMFSKYLLYNLSYRDCQNQFKSLQTGSALKQLPKKSLGEIKVFYPCIEEQTKIANFLSDIDVKIETLNTKIENSKTFKKGLLQQMFV